MEWEYLIIKKQNIRFRTVKSVLINIPNSEFCFWHPNKLLRVKNDIFTIFFTNSFEFICKRYGNSKNILEEKTLSPVEIIDLFSKDKILKRRKYNIPEKIEPQRAEVLNELSERGSK